jgi:hypothetical protein
MNELLYTAKATVTGGRNGHVKSEDGILDIEVRTPESMGGAKGSFLNPDCYLLEDTPPVLTMHFYTLPATKRPYDHQCNFKS